VRFVLLGFGFALTCRRSGSHHSRNNICTIQSYHTYSAVVLRPPINGTDNQMDQDDLASFKALDLRAEATTGYPAVAIGAGFKYDP
jgi:hypothetical protein